MSDRAPGHDGDGRIDFAPIDPADAQAASRTHSHDAADAPGAGAPPGGPGTSELPPAPDGSEAPGTSNAAEGATSLPPLPPIPPIPTAAANAPFPVAGYPYAMPAAGRGNLPVWAMVEERPPWSTRRRVAVGVACAVLAGLTVWGIVALFRAADAAMRGG